MTDKVLLTILDLIVAQITQNYFNIIVAYFIETYTAIEILYQCVLSVK